MGKRPKRRKGREKVTTLGVTSRMTMTSSGFGGMSLDDMAGVLPFEKKARIVNPKRPRRRDLLIKYRFVSGGKRRKCEECRDS